MKVCKKCDKQHYYVETCGWSIGRLKGRLDDLEKFMTQYGEARSQTSKIDKHQDLLKLDAMYLCLKNNGKSKTKEHTHVLKCDINSFFGKGDKVNIISEWDNDQVYICNGFHRVGVSKHELEKL